MFYLSLTFHVKILFRQKFIEVYHLRNWKPSFITFIYLHMCMCMGFVIVGNAEVSSAFYALHIFLFFHFLSKGPVGELAYRFTSTCGFSPSVLLGKACEGYMAYVRRRSHICIELYPYDNFLNFPHLTLRSKSQLGVPLSSFQRKVKTVLLVLYFSEISW